MPEKKVLYCIRHAKSSWDNAALADIDRPLNHRGLRDAPRMAAFFREEGVQPDWLITSPAKRAFSTALFFKEELAIPDERFRVEDAIYEAIEEDIHDIVRQLPDDANTVLLFGHNPTFTYFANRFSEELIGNVPTCGVLKITSTVRHWKNFNETNAELKAFYYPKMLKS